jgi:acyl carrier protein
MSDEVRSSVDPSANSAVQDRVRLIVAEALDVPIERVTLHASLIDDLGAESIDFLDILFRIETAFGFKVREDEMWQGSIDQTDQRSIDASIAQLRERMPDFHWEAFPEHPSRTDLPRLITPRTIVEYLRRRGVAQDGSAGRS